MNDERPDSSPNNDIDRALMDYLDEILQDPAARPARVPLSSAPNVAPFDINRSRKPEAAVAKLKSDNAQPVTLPFRVAEKAKVLVPPDLLTPRQPEPVKEPVPETIPEAVPDAEPEQARIPAPEPVIVAPEPPVEEVVPPPVIVAADETAMVSDERLPPVREWQDNGRPDWAQHRFECLIFNVAGLRLAVPLITLGAIHRIDRKFNALPHQSDWFIGILQTPASGNIKVLDTALCVMPERYDPTSRESLAYVITIHGYAWGLACHDVEKSITLEPDQVKWRTQRGKRPWLAGTVIDQMCALIDTDGFHDLIQKAEQSR